MCYIGSFVAQIDFFYVFVVGALSFSEVYDVVPRAKQENLHFHWTFIHAMHPRSHPADGHGDVFCRFFHCFLNFLLRFWCFFMLVLCCRWR